MKGLRDTISGATESISEIRDTSLINSKDEEEFDALSNQYNQILSELEKCECLPVYKGLYKK